MTWQDNLTEKERAELLRAEQKRDASKEAYNALRLKLKNRAESRMRNAKANLKANRDRNVPT